MLNLLVGIKNGTFSEKDLHIDKRVAVTVMLASQGYPENYDKNKLIDLPEDFNENLIFTQAQIKKWQLIHQRRAVCA